MSTPVFTTLKDDIAWVTIDNPPVNATSQAVRAGLWHAIKTLPPCRLAVLTCSGKTFVAGGDMSEFDAPPIEPHLPDIVAALEQSPTPFLALMQGSVLGGGFELAMGCAYRIAAPGTRFGLPEVNVGLIPGAGGTQRAPRLLGWQVAVDMACLGKMKTAEELLSIGALDLVSDDLEAAVAEFEIKSVTPVSRRTIAPLTELEADELQAKVFKRAKGQSSPMQNFDMLLLASDPFETVQPIERALHLKLRQSDESRALRHVFFAERSVAQPEAIRSAIPRPIHTMAILGGGLMGSGIAVSALIAGLTVSVIEQTDGAALIARKTVEGLLISAVKRGKLSSGRAEACMERLVCGAQYALASDADLVVEAIIENLDAKKTAFARLAEVARPDAILATNTSYLDPNDIFAGIENPSRCLGIHFFSPAHIMKLVEIVAADASSAQTLATGFAFAKRLRKTPVLSQVCDGFIGNRILAAYRRAAEYLLADGALPHEVDEAMRAFGMAMGPFEAQDMAGLQIAEANRRRLDATRDPQERYVPIADRLCAQARYGIKAGKGWYAYKDQDRAPLPDPEVQDLIEGYARDQGITRRSFEQEDIQQLLLAAMANEGALIVQEGIAENDAAVDVVKTSGYGFARWRGGPMHAAQTLGHDTIMAALKRLEEASPNSWIRAERFSHT